MIPNPITIDFETEGIKKRPNYPPKPVGVAIKWPGKRAEYLSFAHPDGNNCTEGRAKEELEKAWESGEPLLFHNGKFDVDVAEEWIPGLVRPDWWDIHDTLFLLFLDDPRRRTLSLKPAAEDYLDEPPSEQDRVMQWLINNQPVPGRRLTPKSAGEFICLAPAKLVGEYAIGDVNRTAKLFNLLYPRIVERGMLDAYRTEQELMPLLLEMEQRGIRVDEEALSTDIEVYDEVVRELDEWIFKKLGKEINLNSGPQLVRALVDAGLVEQDDLGYTPKGNVKTSKDVLKGALKDQELIDILGYRSELNTCLNTFMKPWYATASISDSKIHTQWNSVRTPGEKGIVGTRTGRLSSTPNFQNIPKVFKQRESAYLDHLPPLPNVRGYICPFNPGHVLIGRDYSQQEFRILAHFEGGPLLDAYRLNPWMDVHSTAQEMINSMTGKDFARGPIKNTGFGLIYGMGIGKMAEQSEIPYATAREVRYSYLKTFPGIKRLQGLLHMAAAHKEPIRTWGGREYYCEEPAIIAGRVRTFEYKLLNVLIQGSAADCTKRALIGYINRIKDAQHPHATEFPYLTVHDEILASVPRSQLKPAMKRMSSNMEAVEFNVPMLSEGYVCEVGWNINKRPYDERGEMLWSDDG